MSPSPHRRLDRLVLEAAALDPEARAVFLDGVAADEVALADEVRRRLAAAEDLPESFLCGPATELLEAALAEPDSRATAGTTDEPVPESDERYEIGECLGTGGMARVYRAFDRKLGRPVALKILSATDPETPRRLLREARAQARVRHDHVLDVYETGELGGRPYIAVRYVAGGTLADLGQSIRSEPTVSLEQKVRLVAQVAEGLHAAHREGLLHGDVKPSNVLVEETVDGDLRAWIGDFGIATEIERSGPAAAGLVGTPQYMAPELLRGERGAADRRSDVFSLGVTLYQTLTGELPRRGEGWSDLRRRAPELPGDLAAILARCLAEHPGDRYPSARAVAADLRRFLDGEVVEAYADRLAYRLSRFAARHRALLTLGGISLVLLVAALAVAAGMGVRAVRANERADRRRAQAEDLIGFMLTDLRDKLEGVGRLDLLDDVGERAMGYFAAVPEAELTDQELARRSTALYQIGDVKMRRGDLAGADRPLQESLALARRLAERDPDDAQRQFDLGQSEFWVGFAGWKRGDLDTAREHFEAYHRISEALVARDPDHRDWRRELSYADSNLGSLLEKQGDPEGALERFRAALDLDRELVRDAPTPEEADEQRFELAASHNTVAVILEQLGRLDEAEEQYEADLALRRELAAHGPDNQRWRAFLGTSHQFLGTLLLARGRTAEARPHLEAARGLFDELTARDPDNADWAYKRAWSLLWLGRLERSEGRHAEAREVWWQAEEIARALAAKDPAHADWRQLLGVALYHRALAWAGEDRSAAESEIRRALEILELLAADQPDDPRAGRWLAEALLLSGDLEATLGRRAKAEESWNRAARALAPLVGTGTQSHGILVPWVEVLTRLGREKEAARTRAVLEDLGVPPP